MRLNYIFITGHLLSLVTAASWNKQNFSMLIVIKWQLEFAYLISLRTISISLDLAIVVRV